MSAEFQWPMRVYIEDTDAGGIVYYVNYLKFMERARTEYLRSLGFGKNFIFSAELMFVVRSISCDYNKPARLDDQLSVTAKVINHGKANMVLAQNVYRVTSGTDEMELLSRAEVKLACVDKQAMKPRRIPQEILAAVSQ